MYLLQILATVHFDYIYRIDFVNESSYQCDFYEGMISPEIKIIIFSLPY